MLAASSSRFRACVTACTLALLATGQVAAQRGAQNGEWRAWAGDPGSTRYAALDQIDASNFNTLEVAWRFKTENLGPRRDYNLQATPLMANGVLYFTAGAHRNAVAVDARTGELLWVHRFDEGRRAEVSSRRLSGRGVGYWSDGKGDDRVFYVTSGYQLVGLDAKTGRPLPGFGTRGVVDLRRDADQELDLVDADISWNGAPVVGRNVVIVGAAHRAGTAPRSKINAKGFIRGYDVRTGKRLWIFHTIPMPGEVGNDTWKQDSWAYTGHTGVWGQMSIDEELGLAYLPVEIPTGDYYGGHRPGDNLFAESLVALDLETGERRWHFQFVHHPIWDYDVPCAPILADITVGGRQIKAVAQPTKQGLLFVFDRATGEPVWPIEERPVERGTLPGETYSPTQPMPTKPPAFERNGFLEDYVIDFTPELKAQGLQLLSKFKYGPIYTPPIARGENGKQGLLFIANGANWPGGSVDPETGMLYVYSHTLLRVLSMVNDPKRSDMRYISAGGGDDGGGDLTVQGLPLVKPPWGRISAIDLTTGTIAWQIAHGETPDEVKNHQALQGLDVPRTGRGAGNGGSSGGIGVLTTRTLVISGEGGLATQPDGRKGAMLRAYDKATGREVGAVYMPGMQTGSPMAYMLDGRQYIVLATGFSASVPSEIIAYRLPVATAAPAPPQAADRGAGDEAAVRDVVARYVAARAARDAAAIARLFTADADQYTTGGEWRRGREAIVAGTARSSAQNPGERAIRVDAVRFLSNDVAIADGPYEIAATGDGAGASAGGTGTLRRMWTSLVLVRQAGEWRISAIRNMRPTTPQ